MKKICSGFVLAWLMISCAWADVGINAVNFPDEVFREYVRGFDTNSDGVLSDEELAKVKDIGVADMGITSLRGIEHFTALQVLECSRNNIAEIDLTSNALLGYLGCENNALTALDVSHNPLLRGINLNNRIIGSDEKGSEIFSDEYSRNNLSVLDVSGCPDLEELFVDGSSLSAIDLSHNPKLRMFHCIRNQLSALDVSNCPALESLLPCRNNITALDVRNNIALISLDVTGNPITAFDVSNNTQLRFLCYNVTHVTTADVSNNPLLEDLRFWSTDLEALDVRNCPNLELLHCHNSKVTTLTMGSHPSLRELECGNNQLETLDLTGCPALTILNCSYNNITALDLSNRTALTEAWLRGNQLTALNVAGCSSLEKLGCNTNNLSSLDVSSCSSLIELNCDENSLEALNVSGCTALQYLYCYDNSITTLNISNNSALQHLNCSYNHLDTLTFGSLPNLQHIECDNNSLTALDVTGLPALDYLDFKGNYITDIDLSRNPALSELHCYINRLTALDLSHNTNLAVLVCRHNSLPALDLAANSALDSDALNIRKQIIRSLDVDYDPDNTAYPYNLDLRNYLTASQINNVIDSSVKALDSEGAEIDSAYSGGVIRIALYPQSVIYGYDTGHSKSMDVVITSETFTSADKTPKKASHNNHVYQIIPERRTWQDAKEYCESLGGHLLVISSQEEYSVLEDMLAEAFMIMRKDYTNATFWVGATRNGKEWEWITGDVVTWPTSNRSGYLTITYMGNFYAPYTEPVRYRYFICEWDEASADFAPAAPEYERYIQNPQAYFEGREFYGAIPDPLDLSHLAYNPVNASEFSGSFTAAAVLPSTYSTRALGLLPPVRNQGSYRTCWSFSTLGALEASYNVRTNTNAAPDLSELYQAWFTYRDPREGYSFELDDLSKEVLDQGGDHSKAIAFMSRAGTVTEEVMPYTQAARIAELTEGMTPEDYTHSLRLKEAYRIGMVTSANRDEVKKLIMSHGAVSVTYYHAAAGLSQSSYYLPSQIGYGHAVMLVGWDDNHSSANFSEKGAWLVKNSWGEARGDNGYFWLSYSQTIGDCAVYAADTSGQVLDCKGYDVLTSAGRINYHWSANIFRAENREAVREIAFHTADNNVPYEIYINRLSKDYPVNPGIPEAPVLSGTMPYAGYHTISLNTPLEVEDGEYYAVMVKVGSASTYEYVTAVEDTGTIRAASINAGESYFARDEGIPDLSDWKDGKTITDSGTGRPCNACIKAFTVNLDAPEPEPQETSAGTSGGGSGGCSSVSMPVCVGMLVLAFAVSRKN